MPDNSYRISYYTRSIGFNINLPKYNGGELWHSYLNRVAIANNLPSADVLLGELSPLGDANWNNTQRLAYDCMKQASHSIIIENHDDWILSGTTFKGRAPLMSRIMAARRIYRYSMPSSMNSKIIGTQPAFIQKLRVCPECRREEGEGWYFHTDLQMPGVTICPKHGCALQEYVGPKFSEHFNNDFAECIINPYSEILSSFETDFFNEGFQCDTRAITSAISKRLTEMGIIQNSKDPIPTNPVFKDVLPSPSDLFSSKSYRLPASTVLMTLAGLFGDVETLKTYLPTEYRYKEDFLDAIKDDYTLVSDYRDDFVVVECNDCGFRFPTTPFALINGWGCPDCNRDLSDDMLFSRMVNVHSKNLYTFLPPFTGWFDQFRIKKNTTGEEESIAPMVFFGIETTYDLIYRYNNDKLFPEISEKVASFGDYQLIRYEKVKNQIYLNVRHLACGQEFGVFMTNFVASPYCRCCGPVRTAKVNFLKKLSDLSKNFHLIGEFSDNEVTVTDKKVTFKGKPRTVLGRVDRYVNPKKKTSHEEEHELILKRIFESKGKIMTTEDFLDITNARVITNLTTKLREKHLIQRLSSGIFCNTDETYSLEQIQDAKYVRNGDRGCPIGDSALVRIGAIEGTDKPAFAINYYGKTDNHCAMGPADLGVPMIYQSRTPIMPDNMLEMMFVTSVWHKEAISAEDKEGMLLLLLKNALDKGCSVQKIEELGDTFPPQTMKDVRRLIRRYSDNA